MKAWDYILIAIISVWLIAAVIYLIYRKIKSKGNCGDGCCGHCTTCGTHRDKHEKDEK